MRFLAAAALCALGAFSATLVAACGGGSAAGALSTASVTRSIPTEAEAAPTVTESQTVTQSRTETQTVEQTLTVEAPVAATETASDTDTWVWVLIGIAVAVFIVFIVMFARRGHGGSAAVPASDRQQRMRAAVSSWTAQGWAIERQTTDSAVLTRDGERLLLSLDAAGDVTSDRLAT